ncbi:hypothetical protein IQ264_30415 [Phormidium sp. LEGE 05292]|uniref:hypothetical protein n=1 Tax=[Phormidium] sp. LEGE 05292 TaxID=767427 RepID=UPI00188022FF|nr:hypothetical protein [Phormidium sp. LEGE 05292]MBE9229720.1 hypothetical protein [Phormidium sp. LEGE 05292]
MRIAHTVKPLLIKSNPEDLAYVLEEMFSSEKVEVAPETQERTSKKSKKPTNTLTQNQVNWSITMSSTTKFVATNQLQGFTFAVSTTTDIVELATEVIKLGNAHAATFVHLKKQALELGDKLKQLEAAWLSRTCGDK